MSGAAAEAGGHERGGLSRVVMAVHDRLLKEILTGVRQPGDPVRDRDIAAEFGVSRTPVREAIQLLRSVGVIESSPNRYTRVTRFGPQDIVQAGELLFRLYGEVVRELAEAGRPLPLEAMERSYAAAVLAHEAGDDRAFWTRVFEIHDHAFRESCNAHLLRALWTVATSLRVAVVSNAPLVDPALVLRGNRGLLDSFHADGPAGGIGGAEGMLGIRDRLAAGPMAPETAQ